MFVTAIIEFVYYCTLIKFTYEINTLRGIEW